MALYPLKFRPRFVEKMWGGRKLETVLGKAMPPGKLIGESWELYDFPPGVVDASSNWASSEIANGPLAGRSLHWAVGEFGAALYGTTKLTGQHGQFPILIKFLDAREALSVQVHPDQAYASANPGAHLKSEAWYVLQSEAGARLLNGLKPGVSRLEFEAAIRRGDVDRLIRAVPARPGDCFYLPSGTVHALGAGILVAEVQTPSDTTFRVFDFNRIDPSTGKPRSLHVKQALASIDFGATTALDFLPQPVNAPLVASPYFHLHRHELAPGTPHPIGVAGPIVLIGVEGASLVRSGKPGRGPAADVALARGEVILLPAALGEVELLAAKGAVILQVTFDAETASASAES